MLGLLSGIFGLTICCFWLGVLIIVRKNQKNKIGYLVIDQSFKDEPPLLFTDLDIPIESFKNKKYVVLEIIRKDFAPQK